jgi:hypothetical protein
MLLLLKVVDIAMSVHRPAAMDIVVMVLNAVTIMANAIAVFNGNQSHKYFDKKFKVQQKHGPFLNIYVIK